MCDVDCIHVAVDVIQWFVLLNTEMGLRVVENGKNV
jgi:hypothetical protein